jgi:hypothetical protein
MNSNGGKRLIRCDRCGRRCRNPRALADTWNSVWRVGYLTGFLCPDCQTPEESTEAEINGATLDYETMRFDQFGRASCKAKNG